MKGCVVMTTDQLVSLLVRLWVEIQMHHHFHGRRIRQPPCEAVSWNTILTEKHHDNHCQPPCEAVSWNITHTINATNPTSQPPCEAVSWNSIASPFESTSCSSASLSFEMPFWLCYNRHDISQSLWETVNWKEEYAVIVVSARKLTSILLEEDCEINHSHI